jgi:hypothetical protein
MITNWKMMLNVCSGKNYDHAATNVNAIASAPSTNGIFGQKRFFTHQLQIAVMA